MGRIVVAGLGAGDVPAIDQRVWAMLDQVDLVIFRTEIHPSAAAARLEIVGRKPSVAFESFDPLYERAETFEQLYREMAEKIVEASRSMAGTILYLVPGSPLVAERSVDILRESMADLVEVIPGVSFLELVWSALRIDPFASGVTMTDARDFPSHAKLNCGPFLLTQVWSKQILSEVKLAVANPKEAKAVVLQRLGTSEEHIEELLWDDLDRLVDPDHLTTIYIERIPAAPGPALVELFDIIARLRNECPWDREQTHESLVSHLLEESYEVIDVIEKLGKAGDEERIAKLFGELEGELGDLLVQVYFHSNLASEEGWFDLSDVADTVISKLIRRHPHVFTELEVSSSEEVIANWEEIKKTQEGRESVLEGIPESLPVLMLVSKLLRKATAVGIEIPPVEVSVGAVSRVWEDLSVGALSGRSELSRQFGELLWWIANLAKEIGIDLESALRSRSKDFVEVIEAAES